MMPRDQVTVHPRPETLPILIQVSLSSPRDLANIEAAAAADPGYLISVYTYRRSAPTLWATHLEYKCIPDTLMAFSPITFYLTTIHQ